MAELDQNLPSSDDSDEDFVPEEDGKLSEEDSSGDDESCQDKDSSEPTKSTKGIKKSKRRRVELEEKSTDNISEKEEDTQKEDKHDIDQLWAEFNSSPKKTPDSDQDKETKNSSPQVENVTQVCMFAGEKVEVEKQVPVSTGPGRGRKRGGLSGILGGLGKQPKLSILEKSKLDWNQFKRAEGLEEQLSTFNKGKDGYLEKQDFLQRTDKRQFEQEKEFRNVTRKTLR